MFLNLLLTPIRVPVILSLDFFTYYFFFFYLLLFYFTSKWSARNNFYSIRKCSLIGYSFAVVLPLLISLCYISAKIKLYSKTVSILPSLDLQDGSCLTYTICRKSIITIQILFDLIRFRKDFTVCKNLGNESTFIAWQE